MVAMDTTIKIEKETKSKLDKLSKKGQTYNSVIKNQIISGLDLKKIIKPIPIEIIEKNRPSWKGWLLADTGDIFYIAYREGSGEKNPQQIIQISKSIIESLKIIESPFELLEDVGVKSCRNRFADQYEIKKIAEKILSIKTKVLKSKNKQEVKK